MLNENRLYSISLGVASLQDGLVGVATALSPAMAGHFKFLLHHFFVRLGLTLKNIQIPPNPNDTSAQRCEIPSHFSKNHLPIAALNQKRIPTNKSTGSPVIARHLRSSRETSEKIDR